MQCVLVHCIVHTGYAQQWAIWSSALHALHEIIIPVSLAQGKYWVLKKALLFYVALPQVLEKCESRDQLLGSMDWDLGHLRQRMAVNKVLKLFDQRSPPNSSPMCGMFVSGGDGGPGLIEPT